MKIKSLIFIFLALSIVIIAGCQKEAVGKRLSGISAVRNSYNQLSSTDKNQFKKEICVQTTPTTQPPAPQTSTLAISAEPVTSVAKGVKEGGLDLYATVTSNKPISSVVVQSRAKRGGTYLDSFRARGTVNVGGNRYNTGLPIGTLQCNDIYEYYWEATDSIKTVKSSTYSATITC